MPRCLFHHFEILQVTSFTPKLFVEKRGRKPSLVKMDFIGLTSPLSFNSEFRGCARLLEEPVGLRSKEAIFFEMGWPGFESVKMEFFLHGK